MYIKEIWRYPVKSMGGELLPAVRLSPNGIDGDRVVQIYDRRGRVATSRTYPELLGLHAKLGPDGEPLIDGLHWRSTEVLERVCAIVGSGATLAHDGSLGRFDILPLLVATDGAVAAFGKDRRRLRPNLVIGGVEGLAEREWQGGRLSVGNVEIGVHDLRGRCIMTTFDPDTLEQDPGILKDIVKRFGGKLALNCEVLTGGLIETDARVELTPARPLEKAEPDSRKRWASQMGEGVE